MNDIKVGDIVRLTGMESNGRALKMIKYKGLYGIVTNITYAYGGYISASLREISPEHKLPFYSWYREMEIEKIVSVSELLEDYLDE